VQRGRVDLNAAVRRALSILRGNEGGFQPVLKLAPELPPVLADRVQIEKVLLNLVQNGVEAMRAAGMTAAGMTIEIETAALDSEARVSVRDNGPGMDAQTLQRIFDPFFTTKVSGLGMGLAISRSIVERNGGKLWAEHRPGDGACFHMTLPFAP
jgi:two-component system, LuxR family, sensor kinase FixL